MQIKQQYKYKEDKKNSVVYAPVNDNVTSPAIASSVYVSRLVLPHGRAVARLTLSLEINEEVIEVGEDSYAPIPNLTKVQGPTLTD